jgi:hypothetical protein
LGKEGGQSVALTHCGAAHRQSLRQKEWKEKVWNAISNEYSWVEGNSAQNANELG